LVLRSSVIAQNSGRHITQRCRRSQLSGRAGAMFSVTDGMNVRSEKLGHM